MSKKKIIVICGPTAVGKTDLAIKLAKKFDGELVSADSRQVYKGLDIITAKGIEKAVKKELPWKEQNICYYWEIEGVPVYLLDVVDPSEEFSVSHFETLANRAIENILSRKKLPIIVGGTGFYIKAITSGVETTSIPQSKELRQELEGKTAQELFALLNVQDPLKAGSLNASDRKNPRRLIRALEITRWSTEHPNKRKVTNNKTPRDFMMIGLKAKELVLKDRIEKRIMYWMENGAEEEARKLLQVPMAPQSSSAIVLPAWKDYFENKISREDVANYWSLKDWQYAKRQMTWFKKQKNINWFDIDDIDWRDKVEKLVENWYNSLEQNDDAKKN